MSRISTDPYPAQHTVGQEDARLASWLYHRNKQQQQQQLQLPLKGNANSHGLTRHWISENKEIYDEPTSKAGWAHAYTPGTLVIHRLKRDDWFLKAADYFLSSASQSSSQTSLRAFQDKRGFSG